jgi:hypothetical protein
VWIAGVVLIGLTGAVVGRWWTLLLPFVVCPIYFLGIARWGSGVDDGWQFGALIVLGFSVAAAALGVSLRGLLKPRPDGPAAR